MKVGILTLPLVDNFGGILQAAALYRALIDLGHAPVFLEKKLWRPVSHQMIGKVLRAIPGHNIKNTRSIAKARMRHIPFLDQFLPDREGPLYTKAALADTIMRRKLDAVIVGSDQVWRPDYIEDADTGSYFLDIDGDFRKISYAASFGKSEWTLTHRLADVRRMLKDFDAVSLREKTGVTLCKETLGRADCSLALDPTMLVTPDFYKEMMAPYRQDSPYVLNYVLDDSPLVRCVLSQALAGPARGCEVVKLTLDDGQATLEVPEWVRAFRDAQYVVTDSFHGTVFSILFRKPFICVSNKNRGIDRFKSILSLLGLDNRLVTEANETGSADTAIDYEAVFRRLESHRLNSRAFLEQSLAPQMPAADA